MEYGSVHSGSYSKMDQKHNLILLVAEYEGKIVGYASIYKFQHVKKKELPIWQSTYINTSIMLDYEQ